ncbi:MAG: cytochrome c oxidase subunit I [Flavobacteriales bacterium]|jgi:cytochrome c oxidase subunit 1|nr:cytochrome c oxidase subunit I [Flavobacteriales bacterium]MBT3573253.1 cytochrome c oxidase subunit I [Flavobacteriales bacterium]MBT3677825.1 cytochrome c oxidase subunit I [Flavobacteriales bacterium]MBT3739920.1 cytochrome c oxidase subunit I [Flavobacteriales bacterium]MBT4102227.1 cytochrome c oxidase subunit I [Flavobacteriales bacterium]
MSDHDTHHKENFWTKYVFSMDHKMIAKQFLVTGILMGVAGGLMSILFRFQLSWPDDKFGILSSLLGKWAPEGQMDPNMYLGLVTMHGTIMVFFVLTAGLSGTFSNLLIPLQIGARDMASGFLNMLSYWFFAVSSVIMLSSLFVEMGPAAAGWTIYPPLSAVPTAMPGSGMGMTLWLVSMSLFIIGSLLGSLNYIVTIINLRTKGMSMTRLPLTIWTFFLTAILGVLSFPVLFSAALLLIFDRSLGTSFFLSDIMIAGELLNNQGGSPILFEHLFWFLGHPEVYIIILPALGITSEVISTNSRKPIFGYRAMIGSILAIAFLSFIVWGHHMFITGMDPFLGSVFTFTTLLIAIPSAVKAFNYMTTLWKGNLQFTPAMLFSIGLVSTFVAGGLTGIILGDSALDINVHDTMFVVAHFHIVMGLSAIFGMFAGVYHWYPRMYGRMMNKRMGYLHFWITFISAYGVFFPMHFLGLAGLPRRYFTNAEFPMFDELQDINLIITVFALLGGIVQLVFLFNFFYSMWRGAKAPQNPWRANTLEWTAPVAHIHGNWPGEIPEVHRWPYDYSKPGHDEDFVPQNVPMKDGEVGHS